MKDAIEKLRSDMKEHPSYFTTIYRFTFSYILPAGTRSLPNESAIAYWILLLGDKFGKLGSWNRFITTEYRKSISKDTWNMILEFANYLKGDPGLKNYDIEASWPSVIDEFVEYLKENGDIK